MPKLKNSPSIYDEDYTDEELDLKIIEEVKGDKVLMLKEDGLTPEEQKENRLKISDFGLTVKQKNFVLAYVLGGGNMVKAAKEAYNLTDTNMAGVIGFENLNKVKVKQAIRILMDRYASEDMIVGNLAEIALNGSHYPTRARATELLAKVRGLIDKGDSQQVNINLVQIGLPEQQKRKVIEAKIESANLSEE